MLALPLRLRPHGGAPRNVCLAATCHSVRQSRCRAATCCARCATAREGILALQDMDPLRVWVSQTLSGHVKTRCVALQSNAVAEAAWTVRTPFVRRESAGVAETSCMKSVSGAHRRAPLAECVHAAWTPGCAARCSRLRFAHDSFVAAPLGCRASLWFLYFVMHMPWEPFPFVSCTHALPAHCTTCSSERACPRW